MPNEDRLMDQLVERLHACLAEALNRSRVEPFIAPVTVAEIYQDLVPYRAIRSRLGFEMNADYEHTLLRMLAGEGNHVRLEPKEARDELRAELRAANPNVGLFRKFAGCDVWVATPRDGVRIEPLAAPVAIAHSRDAGRSRDTAWNRGPAAPPPNIEIEWGPPPSPPVAVPPDTSAWTRPPAEPVAEPAPPRPAPRKQPTEAAAPRPEPDTELPLLEPSESPAPAVWEDVAEELAEPQEEWEVVIEESALPAEWELADESPAAPPPPDVARAAPSAPVAEAEGDAEPPELLLDEEVLEDEVEVIEEVELVTEVVYERTEESERVVEVPSEAVPTEPAIAAITPVSETNNEPGATMHTANGNCAFCDSTLPAKRAVKFCPFCGMDQSLQPCGSCGEAMEPDWRFCAACGSQTAVPAGAT